MKKLEQCIAVPEHSQSKPHAAISGSFYTLYFSFSNTLTLMLKIQNLC